MRFTFLFVFALFLCSCEDASRSEDLKLKTSLIGSWYYDYKDTNENLVKGLLTHSENGTFTAREKSFHVENSIEKKSSGNWYVTSGLYKLSTSEVDGKKLSSQESLYFTCKLIGISDAEFSCRDEIAKQTFSYKRAPRDFIL